MEKLYNKNGDLNNHGGALQMEVCKILAPILKRYKKKGFDIGETHNIIVNCTTLLGVLFRKFGEKDNIDYVIDEIDKILIRKRAL